ncbi:MAG TPA: M23 family metallopeptidase [Acholeplasmataceae bacterium]|jgi:hypothetical protein|nr:M23 family metallopeptidase [Acholeplasmataceae bacterium]
MEKDDFNLIDRFLYKLLICSAFLFAIVFLDQVKVVKLEKVRQPFAEHINILPFIQKLNGKESFLLPVDITDQVSAPTYQVYQNSQVIKNGRLIVLDDYQGVENYKAGVVVKIHKVNGLYEVTVKGIDGYEYVYNNLESIDVNIYKYLKSGDIIGLPGRKNDKNFFRFYVYSKGEPVDLFA